MRLRFARGGAFDLLRSPWAGFAAFTLGQLGMWKAAPYFWESMVVAGPSTYEVVQDIVHGFDVVSFFASPFWAIPFGLIWFVPMHAVARPQGLLLPFLFGIFIQIYLYLVFLQEGEFFSFLSAFRYMGMGTDTDLIPALVKLVLGIFGLFGGPVIAAFLARTLGRAVQ